MGLDKAARDRNLLLRARLDFWQAPEPALISTFLAKPFLVTLVPLLTLLGVPITLLLPFLAPRRLRGGARPSGRVPPPLGPLAGVPLPTGIPVVPRLAEGRADAVAVLERRPARLPLPPFTPTPSTSHCLEKRQSGGTRTAKRRTVDGGGTGSGRRPCRSG